MGKLKAKYKVDTKKAFINPYNFVKQDYSNKVHPDSDQKKDHYGRLECLLRVKTPLAILDTDPKIVNTENEHSTYAFFSVDGKTPMIPGSSIRGMMRSMYEAVTNSCMSSVKEDAFITSRVKPENPFKPCILQEDEDGKLHLFQAKRHRIRAKGISEDGKKRVVNVKGIIYKHAQKVRFSAQDEEGRSFVTSINCEGDNEEGWIFVGESFSRKKYESIFSLTKENEYKDVSPEAVKKAYIRLRNTLLVYQDKGINREYGGRHSGYKNVERLNLRDGLPVWCEVKDGMLHLSYAQIGRTTYNRTLTELVKNLKSCNSRADSCKACSLFGMISKNIGESRGSKIRFSDAVDKGGNIESFYVTTLQELSSPRNSYTLFYLNGKAFTYDTLGAELSGRKMYWHNKKVNDDKKLYVEYSKDPGKLKRVDTVSLAPVGTEFKFNIYFDGITDEQFEELKWLVNFGENNPDGDLCYKMGHGNPIGLGSVKCVIEKVVERKIDGAAITYNQTDGDVCQKAEPFSKEKYAQIYKIIDFNEPFKSLPKGISDTEIEVRYPYVLQKAGLIAPEKNENDLANHKWFSENRKRKEDAQRLKAITDPDQRLYAMELYEYSEGDSNGRGSGNYGGKPNNSGFHGKRGSGNYSNGGYKPIKSRDRRG